MSSKTETNKKKRLGPDDFGYTFVTYQPPEGAATAVSAEEGEGQEIANDEQASATATTTVTTGNNDEKEQFIYEPDDKAFGYGDDEGLGGSGSSSSSMAAMAMTNLGACCCFIFVILCLVGGIFIALETNKDESTLYIAGIIIFIISAVSCLCGCVSMCVGCITASVASSTGSVGGGGGGGSGLLGGDDRKEIKIRIRKINDRYSTYGSIEDDINHIKTNVVGDLKDIKKASKDEDKKKKEKQKKQNEQLEKHVHDDIESGLDVKTIKAKYRPTAYYINFDGDVMMSHIELLRKQVSLIVNYGKPNVDVAVIVITSPGGVVTGYGLAASQLVRIRKAGIKLIVCIDTIAASGGFMMASVADMIYAAPFAVVGSIGVVTQIPNFQRFLNKHDIDAYLFTAGKHKRTIDIIGDVTDEGKAKLQEELNDIHNAFKDHISLARSKLSDPDKIDNVATGEGWLAVQAKEKGLVDEIMTSDEYLTSLHNKGYDIIEILEKKEKKKHSIVDLMDVQTTINNIIKTAVNDIHHSSTTRLHERQTPMAI